MIEIKFVVFQPELGIISLRKLNLLFALVGNALPPEGGGEN